VYDEVLVAQADEEGAEPRAGYLRHYLGQMKVPISSVYRSQTVDGTFELQVPPVLLGYTASTAARPLLSVYICLSPNIMLPKSINEEVCRGRRLRCYLVFGIWCTEPIRPHWMTQVVGGEDDAMVRYAQKWQADATKPRQCKARHARALVMTSSGRSVFLPRFLTPLAPPDHLVPHGLAVTDVRSPLPCGGVA
jgi:coiled-coil and C2 domain-containing protein 2A